MRNVATCDQILLKYIDSIGREPGKGMVSIPISQSCSEDLADSPREEIFAQRLREAAYLARVVPSRSKILQAAVQRNALCRSRRELSNADLLATFGFDTASRTSPLKLARSPNECSSREKARPSAAATTAPSPPGRPWTRGCRAGTSARRPAARTRALPGTPRSRCPGPSAGATLSFYHYWRGVPTPV